MKILNLTDRQRQNEYRYEVAVGGGEPSLDYPYSINTLITSGADDTEEDLTDNSVSDAGSYLGLGYESGTEQITGIRFPNLNIPKGATITNAYIQFSNRLNVTGATSIAIQCEAEDNATAFANTTSNLSNRILTTSSVTWSPNDWSTTDARTPNEATNNISEIIQEVVDRVGYTSSSAINIIISLISGTGRIAHSYNHSATTCPEIFIEYSLPYEIDAYQFIQSVETTDTLTTAQKTAIDNLVVGLKANGTWSKYKAIYPFIGGTASSHKWNLKDPYDLDVSFRLLFTDGGGTGWIHSSTGAKPDGTGAYADLGGFRVNPDTNENDVALGIYSKTDVAENSKFGVRLSGNSAMSIMLKDSSNNLKVGLYYDNGSDTLKKIIANAKATTGFWHFSKGGGQYGVFDVLHNGSVFDSGTMNTSSPSASKYSALSSANADFYLGALNFEGTAQDFSSREIAFFCISDYLTQTEVLNDSVLIQEYQEALGRAISIGTEVFPQDNAISKADLNSVGSFSSNGNIDTTIEEDSAYSSFYFKLELNTTANYKAISINYNVTAGKTYRLSFYAKTNTIGNQYVEFIGSNRIDLNSTEWTLYVQEVTFDTTETRGLILWVAFANGQLGDIMEIDNLSIIELD